MSKKAEISRKLRKARKRLITWKAVSQELYQGRINGTILSRIANPGDDYFPVDKDILSILKPKLPKPADDEIAKRTIVIYGTLAETNEYRARYPDPRDRMLDMLGYSEPMTGEEFLKKMDDAIAQNEAAQTLPCRVCGQSKMQLKTVCYYCDNVEDGLRYACPKCGRTLEEGESCDQHGLPAVAN